ncbi:MAG TPA: type II toxin-antitoxin system Phd/YefM family antitoxin [Candidatus Aminicenantes bacterium]|nr:type II toxin-antitoxin system Phd/YefM family antitoxin [Candidatus Aminicenantes bacterium]HEB35964.1 type II toxin-antitoxin system Phd/YefM family antitoxin [Candidatus Aminicenantes bacterium]
MNFSETIPASKAKAYFSELLRRVIDYHESFAITRRGKMAGVLIGIEEYENLIETLEILSDGELMESIKTGLKDEKAGRIHAHEEVFKE